MRKEGIFTFRNVWADNTTISKLRSYLSDKSIDSWRKNSSKITYLSIWAKKVISCKLIDHIFLAIISASSHMLGSKSQLIGGLIIVRKIHIHLRPSILIYRLSVWTKYLNLKLSVFWLAKKLRISSFAQLSIPKWFQTIKFRYFFTTHLHTKFNKS